jgi:thiol-disulfide isomerase/thioredoxin
MKHLWITIAMFAWSIGGFAQQQKIPSWKVDDYLSKVASKDTLYVVNFWATWCVPCVKELPVFDSIYTQFRNQPVKVILLNFDFKEQYGKTLSKWVANKKIKPTVAWLNESNANQYIPRIAPEWEGALPATLLINNRTQQVVTIQNSVTVNTIASWLNEQLPTFKN